MIFFALPCVDLSDNLTEMCIVKDPIAIFLQFLISTDKIETRKREFNF